jgi:uncharacterized protein (UPF0332 family)
MTTEFFYKAKNNFNAAQLCLDNGFYDACANRAYYAALQAALAALADKGIKRDRVEHKWVHADFAGKLIRSRKIYPTKLKSYLPDMQIIRDWADYKSENISRKRASEQLLMAKEMLTLIEKEINR